MPNMFRYDPADHQPAAQPTGGGTTQAQPSPSPTPTPQQPSGGLLDDIPGGLGSIGDVGDILGDIGGGLGGITVAGGGLPTVGAGFTASGAGASAGAVGSTASFSPGVTAALGTLGGLFTAGIGGLLFSNVLGSILEEDLPQQSFGTYSGEAGVENPFVAGSIADSQGYADSTPYRSDFNVNNGFNYNGSNGFQFGVPSVQPIDNGNPFMANTEYADNVYRIQNGFSQDAYEFDLDAFNQANTDRDTQFSDSNMGYDSFWNRAWSGGDGGQVHEINSGGNSAWGGDNDYGNKDFTLNGYGYNAPVSTAEGAFGAYTMNNFDMEAEGNFTQQFVNDVVTIDNALANVFTAQELAAVRDGLNGMAQGTGEWTLGENEYAGELMNNMLMDRYRAVFTIAGRPEMAALFNGDLAFGDAVSQVLGDSVASSPSAPSSAGSLYFGGSQ